MIYISHCLTRQQTVPNCPFKVFQRALKKNFKKIFEGHSVRDHLSDIILGPFENGSLSVNRDIFEKGPETMAASSKLSILFSHQKSRKIPRLMSDFELASVE